MPPRGSVKWEIGELPQMAQQEHGGNRGFRVFLYAPVVKHLFTGRAGRNLEVHATVVVGFVGGGEVEVGEQNLVGPFRGRSKIQPGYAAVSGTRDVRRRSSSIRCRT